MDFPFIERSARPYNNGWLSDERSSSIISGLHFLAVLIPSLFFQSLLLLYKWDYKHHLETS